jgi:hypothetical protein
MTVLSVKYAVPVRLLKSYGVSKIHVQPHPSAVSFPVCEGGVRLESLTYVGYHDAVADA